MKTMPKVIIESERGTILEHPDDGFIITADGIFKASVGKDGVPNQQLIKVNPPSKIVDDEDDDGSMIALSRLELLEALGFLIDDIVAVFREMLPNEDGRAAILKVHFPEVVDSVLSDVPQRSFNDAISEPAPEPMSETGPESVIETGPGQPVSSMVRKKRADAIKPEVEPPRGRQAQSSVRNYAPEQVLRTNNKGKPTMVVGR